MLVQDSMTGYLHEVPDQQLYEVDPAYLGQAPDYQLYETEPVVYDGFGNPVGLPFLAPLAAKVLPALASRFIPAAARALPGIIRGVQGAVRRFAPIAQQALPGVVRQLTPAVQAFQQALPGVIQQLTPAAQAFQQALPGVMQEINPYNQAEDAFAEIPYPMPPLPFRPPGWIARPQPYTGLRPRRFYMRCLAWPGPGGLVPASAAATAPSAVVPPAGIPAGPAVAPRPIAPIRRIRRRARR